MAKQLPQFKLKAMARDELEAFQFRIEGMSASTATDAGVAIRTEAVMRFYATHQDKWLLRDKLMDLFIAANQEGYPTQSEASAKLWAGKAFARLRKEGVLETR